MALAKELESFFDVFGELEDPRIQRSKLHPMPEILLVSVCGVIAGCDGWCDIEQFAKQRVDFLRHYLPFLNGIPSDDTLRRFFRAIDPKQFQRLFSRWSEQWFGAEQRDRTIAIDGKTLRGSADGADKALHLVSAFASEARIVLGQLSVDEKSNEITAIPALLEVLDLQGATVTIDAMGCQHKIAQQIVDSKADYVLGLKGNQPALHEDVTTFFDNPPVPAALFHDEQVDKGHGRIEVRKATTCTEVQWLRERHPKWDSVKSIILIESQRILGQHSSYEKRYYLSSLSGDAHQAQAAVRAHWAIENGLHWVLDMSFGEDQSRIRKGHATANVAVIRHAVLNAINRIKPERQSVKRMRKMAGWGNDVLQDILQELI
jgi:predicted transposase YbfD/YdcC